MSTILPATITRGMIIPATITMIMMTLRATITGGMIIPATITPTMITTTIPGMTTTATAMGTGAMTTPMTCEASASAP